MTQQPIEELLRVRLQQHGSMERLPEFARWFARLGRLLYESQRRGERRFVSVVVPTRAYASAFIALGALDAALATAEMPDQQIESGTLVRIWNADGTYNAGTFLGRETKTVLGVIREYVSISLAGEGIIRIPSDIAFLEPIESGTGNPSGFNGKQPPAWFASARHWFPYSNLTARLSSTGRVAAIIGTSSIINTELEDTEFFARGGVVPPIAFSRLLFTQAKAPFEREVEIIPATSSKADPLGHAVRILDGPQAVFNFGGLHNDQATVAILETTNSAFDAAVTSLLGNLHSAEPDNAWSALAGERAPYLEWTCHRT